MKEDSFPNNLKRYKLKKNNSTYYKDGSTWKNNDGCAYTIIGSVEHRRNGIYLIEFVSGGRRLAEGGDIKKGCVKDYNYKSVINLGCVGYGIYNSRDFREEYVLWSNVMHRCHNENTQNTKRALGYKDCSVSERWHNFQNFCGDVLCLNNYLLWKEGATGKGSNPYVFDKDIKVEGNKVYSKDTCMFVTIQENMDEMAKRCNVNKYYTIAHAPDGETHIITNVTDFCKTHNLSNSSVGMCLSDKYKQHKGWTFVKGELI